MVCILMIWGGFMRGGFEGCFFSSCEVPPTSSVQNVIKCFGGGGKMGQNEG